MKLIKLERISEVAAPHDVYINLERVSYLSGNDNDNDPYPWIVGLSGTVSFGITRSAFDKIRLAMESK